MVRYVVELKEEYSSVYNYIQQPRKTAKELYDNNLREIGGDDQRGRLKVFLGIEVFGGAYRFFGWQKQCRGLGEKGVNRKAIMYVVREIHN